MQLSDDDQAEAVRLAEQSGLTKAQIADAILTPLVKRLSKLVGIEAAADAFERASKSTRSAKSNLN